MSRWYGENNTLFVNDEHYEGQKGISIKFENHNGEAFADVAIRRTEETRFGSYTEFTESFHLWPREVEVLWDYCGDNLGKTKKIVDLLKAIHGLGALGEEWDSKIRLLLADEFNDWTLYEGMSHLAYTHDKKINE